MKFKGNIKVKTKVALIAHFNMSIIVILFLILAGIKHFSNGVIDTDEMFTTFMMATTILLPVILIILVLTILFNSFFNSKTLMLLALLCLLIAGVQYDILIFILPYPMATLVIFSKSLTKNAPQ